MLSRFCHVQLLATLWTITCQAPLSMGFSRQEFWSELPFPPPGDLPDPGIAPASSASLALAGGFFTTNATWASFLTLLSYLTFKTVVRNRDSWIAERLVYRGSHCPAELRVCPAVPWPVACFDGNKERVKTVGS